MPEKCEGRKTNIKSRREEGGWSIRYNLLIMELTLAEIVKLEQSGGRNKRERKYQRIPKKNNKNQISRIFYAAPKWNFNFQLLSTLGDQ